MSFPTFVSIDEHARAAAINESRRASKESSSRADNPQLRPPSAGGLTTIDIPLRGQVRRAA
jgi:hypothetical protein